MPSEKKRESKGSRFLSFGKCVKTLCRNWRQTFKTLLHHRVAILLLLNFEQISPSADSSWQSKPLIFVHRLSANEFLFLPQINPLKEDKYEKTDSNDLFDGCGYWLQSLLHTANTKCIRNKSVCTKKPNRKKWKNLHLKPNTTQPNLNIIKSIATNIIKMNPQQ